MDYLKGIEHQIIFGSKVHYFDELCKSQKLDSHEILINSNPLNINISEHEKKLIKAKCSKINLNLDNFAIFSPETVTCAYYSKKFWYRLRDLFTERNVDVFLNITDEKNYIEGTKTCPLSIREILCLASMAKRIIGVRSGLLEILASRGIPMDVLYTCFPLQEIQTGLALVSLPVLNFLKMPAKNFRF